MITYKDITEVDVLQQASENTKVLVNEGGELMQAPYSNFEDKMNNAEVVEGIPVGATALINDSNKLKQIPLAVLDYNNLANAEVIEQVSENSMALVNDGGVIKQVSCGAGFGGGVKTAIVKSRYYMNSLPSSSPRESILQDEYICENMTFEEARNIILSGEPLDVIMMGTDGWDEPYIVHPHICVININGPTPCIQLWAEHIYNGSIEDYTDMTTYWTADGFLFDDPNTVV